MHNGGTFFTDVLIFAGSGKTALLVSEENEEAIFVEGSKGTCMHYFIYCI